MSTDRLVLRLRPRMAVAVVVSLAALVALAGCGSNSSSTSSAPGASSSGGSSSSSSSSSNGGATSVSTSSCGPKPGVKASGSPIVLGAINTKQPGTDFTDQPNMEQAYFDCVNANGGVNGHVVKLIGLTDQPTALAKAANVPITALTENVPINDANSVALDLVNKAGSNGWVVLNFTPPEALVILQAAQKLGLEGRVKGWGCSTPCDTDFLANALGPKWNHKLFVNAELAPPDSTNTPTMNLYKAILKQYGSKVSGGIGSFSQMGFLQGELAVHALQNLKGAYTFKSVNQAFHNIKGYDTGMLCQPWTFGSYPLHIANNTDYTVTPENGKMVLAQGCTPISSVDPQIAAYHKVAG